MTRVLFVDDEPILLRSMARALRGREIAWEPRFAGSGTEALLALEREPFDIVVSDVRMPGMDGVTLLGHVRDRHPHVARFALTGQSAVADGARAVGAIHQWISKPCELRGLCGAIDRVAWARTLVADPVLLARTSALASVPSPPRLFFEIPDALHPNAPMTELVGLVEHDPAVVAKLLHLGSSAFFDTGARVTSIARAVDLIGTDTLRGLLLGADGLHEGAVAAALAAHSLVVAGLARERVPRPLAGDAFVAGLLHDLGELIVDGDAAPHDHAAAGALLLGLWGLPREIVAAVAFHHDPAAAPDPTEPILVAVAEAERLAAAM